LKGSEKWLKNVWLNFVRLNMHQQGRSGIIGGHVQILKMAPIKKQVKNNHSYKLSKSKVVWEELTNLY